MAHIIRQNGRHGRLISSVSEKSMGALILVIMVMVSLDLVRATFDYADALGKSILFFEAQRSGRLPLSNRVPWRGDSALQDGKAQYVDLVGGYYDAGDHVKFGLPQAFTITMLSWGVVEYGRHMAAAGQLDYALEAIRWGTDYFIKAHPEPNVFWAEVGDGDSDHNCWERAEDMTTSRTAYKLDPSHPGSEVAGETAAAMAAASIAFRQSDPPYSQSLLLHARQLFKFGDTYQGNYDVSIPLAKEYYGSVSGYKDELLWAALWLYEATGDNEYLDYALNNANSYGGTGWMMKEFSWDVKYAGVQILASKILLGGGYKGGDTAVLKQFQEGVDFYLCSLMQMNGGNNVQRTSGGLLYTRPWNNMQYVTTASFALAVYSDYLSASNQQLHCPAGTATPTELLEAAQSQVNYILGNNPMKMSYMVGYGAKYPQRVHHRGASIVPFNKSPSHVGCKDGYANWYERSAANPSVLVGAIVGGPDQYDNYADDRTCYEQSEPTTCTSGALVGLLARFAAAGSRPLDNGHYISRPASPPPPPPTRNSTSSYSAPRHPSSPQTPPPSAPPPAPRSPPLPRRQPAPGHGYVRPLVIQQLVTKSWIYKSKLYRRIEVRVTNVSRQKISNIRLLIKDLSGPIWGVTKVQESVNLYTFPPWVISLDPHNTLKFVYIQPGTLAAVSMATSSTMTY